MGCGDSKETDSSGRSKRAEPKEYSPEEMERKRKEKEEEEKWIEEAKKTHPPPFPKPELLPEFYQGGDETGYKEYMRKKLEYEEYENSLILIGRKLRKEASESA